MKKLFLPTLVFAFVLSACGGVKTTGPNDTYAKETQAIEVKAAVPKDTYAKQTQAIVEKWMASIKNRDPEAALSLYSEDVTWRDCSGAICDPYNFTDLKIYIPRDMSNPDFKLEFQSYFITNFGRFAIIEATYVDPKFGQPTPTHAIVILEILEGKIVNETWYYIAAA